MGNAALGRFTVPLALTLGLVAPAAANAATVHLAAAPSPPPNAFGAYGPPENAVYYTAAPGERNNVTVSSAKNGVNRVEVTLHDEGAPVNPGDGCTQVDEHTAHCAPSAVPGTPILTVTQVALGDGDDTLHTHVRHESVILEASRAFGGSGDDVLVGGSNFDELYGGGGHDRLLGGDGPDFISDGDRSGATGAAGPHADVMDGGPSHDVITYRGRTAPVTVDLRHKTSGERGENDAIKHFEDAEGGAGADRLTGSGTYNYLFGGRGNDVLRGLGDSDRLWGGHGRDRIAADAGGDLVIPGAGIDSFTCGGRGDLVLSPVAHELIRADCEGISYNPLPHYHPSFVFGPSPHPLVSRRFAKFEIPCPDTEEESEPRRFPCNGTVTLRKATGHHKLLGRARRTDDRVRVRLTRAGRRLVGRRHGVVATVRLHGDTQPGLPNVAWTIRLKRRGG